MCLCSVQFISIAYAVDDNTVTTSTASTSKVKTTKKSNADNPVKSNSWTTSGDIYDKYEWGFMGYIGSMASNDLLPDLHFDYGGIGPGTLYVFEADRQLPRSNWARRLFRKLVSTIELASNVTYETDPTGPLLETNNYFVFRWRDFPWSKKLLTTLGIGEGVSWASHNPQQEIRTEEKAGDARKFLNYVMVEATFALPKHPEWELLYRLHHRSGVFGLYCPGIVGSTAVGFGLRYWME